MTTKTLSEIASIFRVTPRAVRQWLDAGMPVVKRAARGEQCESVMDFEQAARWYFATHSAQLELMRQQAALARERAEGAAMQNAEARSDLASIEEIARQFSNLVKFAEQTLLAIPARVAPAIAKTSNAAVIEALLRDEIHARLHELANYSGERRNNGRRARAKHAR
jgi:phage terminase Nu1 subunit (DNA packaging protein)